LPGDSLNAAWEIAKALRAADTQIKTAELKLKLADMMSALADAKSSLADVQGQLLDNARELDAVDEALRNRDKVAKQWHAYYTLDDSGKPQGSPYCMRCWEADHKLHHLQRCRGNNSCPVCKSEYMTVVTQTIQTPPP